MSSAPPLPSPPPPHSSPPSLPCPFPPLPPLSFPSLLHFPFPSLSSLPLPSPPLEEGVRGSSPGKFWNSRLLYVSFITFWHAKGGLQMCVFLGRAIIFFGPSLGGGRPPRPPRGSANGREGRGKGEREGRQGGSPGMPKSRVGKPNLGLQSQA